MYELINFSDCEGIINTECCTKIYEDLLTLNVSSFYTHDQEAYYNLLVGFKFASENNGVITFG